MTALGEVIVGEVLIASTAIVTSVGYGFRRLRQAADNREERQEQALQARNTHVDGRLDEFEDALEVMARGQATTVAQLQPLTTRVDALDTRSHTLSETVAVLANTVDMFERYSNQRQVRRPTRDD